MIDVDPAVLSRVPRRVRFVVWSDPDGGYMGLAREVSVYATGQTLHEAASNLEAAAWSYIEDALKSEHPGDLLPRSVSRVYWWRLLVTLWLREKRAQLASLLTHGRRPRNGYVPELQYMSVPAPMSH